MADIKLKPCVFCGSKAKLHLHQMRFIGVNGIGDKMIRCGAQVICNRCHARGSIYTANLINPYDMNCKESVAYKWITKEAAEAWNRRADNDD